MFSSSDAISEKIKPKFHHLGGTKEAKKESEEAIWLRAILKLKKEDLGMAEDTLLEKFKALLVLQFHQLFYLRMNWQIAHAEFMLKSIQEKVDEYYKSLGNSFDEKLFLNYTDSKQVKSILIDRFAPFTDILKEQLLKCFTYETSLHLPADVIFQHFSIYEKLADELQDFYINFYLNNHKKPEAVSFHKKIHQTLGFYVFKKNVVNGAPRFNINEINKIENLKKVDVFELAFNCEFFEISTILDMKRDYFAYQDEYLVFCNDTLKHLQTIAPEITNEKFSIYYEKAFHHLASSRNKVFCIDGFLFELYLQQARKVKINYEVFEEVQDIYLPAANACIAEFDTNHLPEFDEIKEIYLPAANDYLTEEEKITITINDLSRWVRIAKTKDLLPKSLQHIVETSFKILTKDIQQQASEEKNINTITTPQNINIIDNYANELEKNEVDILVEMVPWNDHYTSLFQRFSKKSEIDISSENEEKKDDRAAAIKLFKNELQNLRTVDDLVKIAALVTSAKPCINQFRQYFWAHSLVSNEPLNNTWKEVFTLAQTQAFNIIENEFNSSAENARPLLEKWRDQPLFTKYYGSASGWLNWMSNQNPLQQKFAEMLLESEKKTTLTVKI